MTSKNNEREVPLARVMEELRHLRKRHTTRTQQNQQAYEYSKGSVMKDNYPTEEHPRRRREPDPPPDYMSRTYRNSQFVVHTFSGRDDPEAYLEWERLMERVISQHHQSETKKVAVATAPFTDYALSWWDREVAERRRYKYHALVKWEDLKYQLRRRYVPNSHYRILEKQFQELTQGDKSVEEYFEAFEALHQQLRVQKSEATLMDHFIDGLQERIARKVERYTHYDLQDLLQHALQVEQQVNRRMAINQCKSSKPLGKHEPECFKQSNYHEPKEMFSSTLERQKEVNRSVQEKEAPQNSISVAILESQQTLVQCVESMEKPEGEQVHGKRNSKVGTLEPENIQVKEVDKSGQDDESEDEHIEEEVVTYPVAELPPFKTKGLRIELKMPSPNGSKFHSLVATIWTAWCVM